jgi:phage shock protein A
LSKKEAETGEAVRLSQEAERHEQMANTLQANVNKIKSTITTYENDLVTLKARARTAASTKKINEQLAKVDSSGTIAMLEKMKAKVEEDESLAMAYSDMASADKSVDDVINSALEGGQQVAASDHLLELKKKMGIE